MVQGAIKTKVTLCSKPAAKEAQKDFKAASRFACCRTPRRFATMRTGGDEWRRPECGCRRCGTKWNMVNIFLSPFPNGIFKSGRDGRNNLAALVRYRKAHTTILPIKSRLIIGSMGVKPGTI
jgi:hypothetical protein